MEQFEYEHFDTQIDKFLRNQMCVEEATRFKAELSADKEKMQRARIIALMIKSMHAVGLKRDKEIVETIKSMDEVQFRTVAGLKPRRILLWTNIAKYAVAACFVGLLAFSGFRYHSYHQTISLGQTAYSLYNLDLFLDGETDTYRGGNVNIDAVSNLVTLFDNVKMSNDVESAIKELEGLYAKALNDEAPYGNYVDDIAWNLAIAYLKDGDRSKPIPLLKGMIERNKGYSDIVCPAQELIHKIEEL